MKKIYTAPLCEAYDVKSEEILAGSPQAGSNSIVEGLINNTDGIASKSGSLAWDDDFEDVEE